MILQYLDYDGNLIEKYDDVWTTSKGSDNFKANYVTGIKTMTVQPNPSAKIKDKKVQIKLYEVYWIMNRKARDTILFLSLAHLFLIILVMSKCGIFEKRPFYNPFDPKFEIP